MNIQPLFYVKYLALNWTSCDTWLMKRNTVWQNTVEHFSIILLVSWCEVCNLDWIEFENTQWRKVKQIQKHSGALLALYSWWYGVKSVTLMTTMWQRCAKWTDSTCKTMGCVNFICQTSLNLYFYFHLIVTMATCPFKIQTCLDCATWLHRRAQIKSQSIHANLATCI